MVIAFEENVIDGVKVAAVGAGCVIAGVSPEAEGIASVESVARDDLEGGGLVRAGLGGEDP